jgi:SAM-dependent methyltransferase
MATQPTFAEDYAWADEPVPDSDADRAIWARIDAVLRDLHVHNRHAIRIIEVGCGDGKWLIRTAARARELGFTAIEGRGVDRDTLHIAAARCAAHDHPDPAIGLTFEVGTLGETLEEEGEQGCDILLSLGDALDGVGPGALSIVARAMMRCADAAAIVTVAQGKCGRCMIEALPLPSH